MKNIDAAMDKPGVRRITTQSTLSVKDQNDKPELRGRAPVFLAKIVTRPAYEEIVSVAETLRASDIDWTILRMTMLNNKSGKVKAGYLGEEKCDVDCAHGHRQLPAPMSAERKIRETGACDQQLKRLLKAPKSLKKVPGAVNPA